MRGSKSKLAHSKQYIHMHIDSTNPKSQLFQALPGQKSKRFLPVFDFSGSILMAVSIVRNQDQTVLFTTQDGKVSNEKFQNFPTSCILLCIVCVITHCQDLRLKHPTQSCRCSLYQHCYNYCTQKFLPPP